MTDDLWRDLRSLPMITMCATLFFLTPLWGPRLVLGGILPEREPREASFQLTDLLSLMVYLSLANGTAAISRNPRTGELPIALLVLANLLCCCIWYTALQFNRAHQLTAGRRTALQLLFFPASIFSCGLGVTGLFLLIVLGLNESGFLLFHRRAPLALALLALGVTSSLLLRGWASRVLPPRATETAEGDALGTPAGEASDRESPAREPPA